MAITIREFNKNDIRRLYELMKALASFENYLDSFKITPSSLLTDGLMKYQPDFHCLVADNQKTVVGYLVYYYLPFTAKNQPAIYMKELYVDLQYRGQQIGARLMQRLKSIAIEQHCCHIQWTVAPWNTTACHFYQQLGAYENKDWLHYQLDL